MGIENRATYFTMDGWPSGKHLASSPAIWRRMFEVISSGHFDLNHDPSHLLSMQRDWLKPWREFAPKLFHVHAKDVRLNRQVFDDHGILATPLPYPALCIPDFVEIDWRHFLGTLMEFGYERAVCIEVEDDAFGRSLAGRQRVFKAARNVLAPCFP